MINRLPYLPNQLLKIVLVFLRTTNRDGDEDFLVFSEFYSFFVEKSFLLHGYSHARRVGEVERRP